MRAMLPVFLLMLAVPCGLMADGDQDLARRAYEAGEIVSLGKVLAAVGDDFEGDIIEVELEREDDKWIYEVELLTNDGRVLELIYDAATVELQTKDPSLEAARKSK